MQLKIYNTLSGKIENFEPIDKNNVRMYVCGPTVYDRAHIGNARPAVVFDILYRILKKLYKKVTYVRNITDIDDKIYKAASERNISIQELTESTAKMYHEDIEALNVLPVDIEPLATEHIDAMIDLIDKLIQNGNAYCVNNHVFFDVSSFENYGVLSKKNKEDLIAGSRIEVSDLKKNPLDFVLWKPIDEKFNIGWESPWGVGRPGWHIECSAMSLKYLGEYFDIHGGGIDLVFPHPENEIAQSCAINGDKTMAKYWVHNGHLNINNVKMSKSLGNFFTVHELLEKCDGEVIRMAFLMSHYAAPMNFTEDTLTQARNILDRWYTAIRHIKIAKDYSEVSREVKEALLNDMNTPKAISLLHELVDDINKEKSINNKVLLATTLVNTCRDLLGILTKNPIDWFCSVCSCKKEWVEDMIYKRNEAKKQKDYEKADKIRTELLQNGIMIEDTKDGTIWKTNC